MDGRPKLNVVLVATLVVLAAGSAACAECIPAGSGEGASITNQFAFDAEYDGWRMWNVPDPGYAHHVSYDPRVGPWIKVLELPTEVISGAEYRLSENVKICPNDPNVALWTGWHGEIVTEGWTWSGEASIEMTGGIPGGHGFYGGQIDGDVLEFDFGSAVDSDAFLNFSGMTLVYDAAGQGLPAPDGPIVLHQYALVPEPGSFALLGFGLLSVLIYRLRRRP